MIHTEKLFSFQYDGVPFWELPYTAKTKKTDNVTVTEYTLPDGFCLTVRRTDYPEEGGVEWVNTFSNRGSAPSGIVSELFDADVTVPFSHEDPRRWTATFPERETATKIYAPFGSDWSADVSWVTAMRMGRVPSGLVRPSIAASIILFVPLA